MILTKQDLQEWNSHPVTKAIVEEIKRAQQESREQSTLMPTADETAQRTAKKEGFIEGVTAFLDAYEYVLDEADQ